MFSEFKVKDHMSRPVILIVAMLLCGMLCGTMQIYRASEYHPHQFIDSFLSISLFLCFVISGFVYGRLIYRNPLKRMPFYRIALSSIMFSVLISVGVQLKASSVRKSSPLSIAINIVPRDSELSDSYLELLQEVLLRRAHVDVYPRDCWGYDNSIDSLIPSYPLAKLRQTDIFINADTPLFKIDSDSAYFGGITLVNKDGDNVQVVGENTPFSAKHFQSLISRFVECLPVTHAKASHTVGLSDKSQANYYYLLGQSSYLKRTRDSLLNALEQYKLALSFDSCFALAQAGVAEARCQLYVTHWDTTSSNLEEAFRYANNAIANGGNLPQTHKSLSLCLASRATRMSARGEDVSFNVQLDQAIKSAKRSLDLDSSYYPACVNLISLHSLKQEFNLAHYYYVRAIENCPSCPLAHVAEATALFREAKYRECISILYKAISLKDDLGIAHYNMACAYVKTGDRYKAMRALRRALICGDLNYDILLEVDPDIRPLAPDGDLKRLVSGEML